MNTQTQKEELSLHVEHYIVAYIDILGQTDHLKTMKMPTNDIEKQDLINSLKNTIGKIKKFRDSFDMFLKAYENAQKISQLPRESHYVFSAANVKKHYFSDTVILYAPLAQKNNNFALCNIFPIFAAISKLYLFMLSTGFVFRGGIDIGVACEISNEEIYGNALYKAYMLEKEAGYPRVIVGDEIINCVKSFVKSGETLFQPCINAMASACLNYIQKDCNDSMNILLPMREEESEKNMNEWKNAAISFTDVEINRFSNENELKLKHRYECLKKTLNTLDFS